MKSITIDKLADLDILLRVARTLFESQGKLTVIVKKYERDISAEQRGLYFQWVGIIGSELGYTKDECHNLYKERFLANIFLADPENHQQFCDAVAAMRDVKNSYELAYVTIRKYILAELSITKATTKNMSAYMEEIENDARGLNIRLPLPEDKGII